MPFLGLLLSLIPLLDKCEIIDKETGRQLHPEAVAGDKAYRSEAIDEQLTERGVRPVIPSKSNEDQTERKVELNQEQYRDRNIVKRLIGWLKESRRILTQFEKKAANFIGMIKMAFIQRYLKTRSV